MSHPPLNLHVQPKAVSWKAWFVWFIAAFFYGYEFMLRASPSVMQNEMMHDFGLDTAGLGFVVSLYYWAYACMQVPAGLLIDRFGPRLVLTIAAFLCALSAFLTGIAQDPILAGAARFLMGFGSAFALLGTFKVAGNWFPENRFGFMAGCALMFGNLGAFMAGSPTQALVTFMGWRGSMTALSIIGVTNALIIWLWVRNYPVLPTRLKESPIVPPTLKEDDTPHPKLGAWDTFKKVTTNPQSWYIGLYAAMIYVPITCFAELWGPPYIMKYLTCDRAYAAWVNSLIFMGIMVGAPLFGWISDRLNRRKLPLYIGTIMTLGIMGLILSVTNIPHLLMAMFMFLMGAGLGSHMVLFALIRENNPADASAVAAGFGNFVCMIVPGFFQFYIGFLLNSLNTGVDSQNLEACSFTSFQISLSVLVVCLVLALVFLKMARETFAVQRE